MNRSPIRWAACSLTLALVTAVAGCGSDGKKEEPKLANPNAPKFEPKMPAGGGAPGKPAGPQGAPQ